MATLLYNKYIQSEVCVPEKDERKVDPYTSGGDQELFRELCDTILLQTLERVGGEAG